MAKKKAQQKNTQAILISIAIVVVSLIILGIGPITQTVGLLSNWVVKVNGEKVSKVYFNTALYEQKLIYGMFTSEDADWSTPISGTSTLADMAKENALNGVVSTLLKKQKANERSLPLSEEDQTAITEKVAGMKEQFGEDGLKAAGVSDADLTAYATDYQLGIILDADITKDFTFDEAAFETYFQEYLTTNKQSLTSIDADYIRTETLEEAQAAQAELDAGMDFVDAVKAYSADYNADTEYASVTVSTSLFPQEVVDAAFALTADSVSDIVETESNGCFILRVNSITEPDVETLRPTQQETYISDEKQKLITTEMETWSGEAKIEVNSILYATMYLPGVDPKATPSPTQDPAAATEGIAGNEGEGEGTDAASTEGTDASSDEGAETSEGTDADTTEAADPEATETAAE